MAGIVAAFCDDGLDPSLLAQMLGAVKRSSSHVGGFWQTAFAGLGASVLQTTQESLGTEQPCANGANTVAAVFDGYLTNWEELRAKLSASGAKLRDHSDAELVLRAYEKWNDNCVDHIEGEFAFAVVDCVRRRLFCARDHAGLRPLFYRFDGRTLLVASDLAALAKGGSTKPTPDLDYLAGVAADMWFDRKATPWTEIRRLPASQTLSFEKGKLKTGEYWALPTDVAINYANEADYFEHYRELLTDCVRHASRSHAPLAVTVSGGLDSSALYCLIQQLQQRSQLPAPGFCGFALAAEPGSPGYEVPYARAAAEFVGETLEEVELYRPQLDWFSSQPGVTCDIPIATNGAMSIGLEQQAAAAGCRVLIGGDGGDEWLHGSRHYYRQLLAGFDLSGLLRAIRSDAGDLTRSEITSEIARQSISLMMPGPMRRKIQSWRRRRNFSADESAFWIKPQMRRMLQEQEERYAGELPDDPVASNKVNMLRSPRNDMANSMMYAQYATAGIEPRSPMLSKRFITFAAALPEHIKLRGETGKFIHRRAMVGVLPEKILERRTKADFPSEDLDRQFAKFVSGQGRASLNEVCDPAGLDLLLKRHAEGSGEEDLSWQIWGVYACAAFLYQHAR